MNIQNPFLASLARRWSCALLLCGAYAFGVPDGQAQALYQDQAQDQAQAQDTVQNQADEAISVEATMKAVHEYGLGHKSAAASPAFADQTAAAPKIPTDTDGPYQSHMGLLLALKDFDGLEKEARGVRTSRARLKGGVWKLAAFYDGVTKPSGGPGGIEAKDSDWKTQLATINKWIAAYPKSAAARIALAETYINYAWAARGEGYADGVTESNWQLFGQRIQLGEAALLDGAGLDQKCPYWYEAMQQIALAQGWDKDQARALFDEASAFEPSYYHFYREYANYLLPKWYGEPGETQAFADEVMSTRLAEPDGSIAYFEIATLLACQCDDARNSLEGMSWPIVKRGYNNLQRLYGTSSRKANRFAFMTYLARDKSGARDAFAALNEMHDDTVWRSDETFESAKSWANLP
jgi:hypothetical protein